MGQADLGLKSRLLVDREKIINDKFKNMPVTFEEEDPENEEDNDDMFDKQQKAVIRRQTLHNKRAVQAQSV